MKKNFKTAAEMFISDAFEEDPTPEAKEELNIPKGYRLAKEYKTERLQLLIRPTTRKGLKMAAEQEEISVNELINNILDEFIERKGL